MFLSPISLIKQFDATQDNPYWPAVVRAVNNALIANQGLQFLLFTCSTIQSEYLFDTAEPWNYISLDPTGNNLAQDLPRLQQVLREIGMHSSSPIHLTILIGNTDPYYIYLQQFQDFPASQRSLLWQRFGERWQMYRDNFEAWIKQRLVITNVQTEVVSWFAYETAQSKIASISFEDEFNSIYPTIQDYFSQHDFTWELNRLKTQFGPSKYFEHLICPSDDLLKDWIRRKFTEYAIQGRWIFEQFPNAILIQNEKPSDLRSHMYQPLIRQRGEMDLPVVYFFGVDNAGYM